MNPIEYRQQYRVDGTPKTLLEKLRECSDCINEIEQYVGADYIADFQIRLAESILDVLLNHFKLSELNLETGTIVIKSDNSVINTRVCVGDVPLDNITKIAWTLDAEDDRCKLQLTF